MATAGWLAPLDYGSYICAAWHNRCRYKYMNFLAQSLLCQIADAVCGIISLTVGQILVLYYR